MAAGLITLTVGNGNGGTFTARFWSSDGTAAGLLYPAPVMVDSAGTPLNTFASGNLPVVLNFAGTATGLSGTGANADGTSGAITALNTAGFPFIFNTATWDRIRSVINATNSVGTGIQAVGLIGQLDDTAPTAITENQFGNVRIGALRQLLDQRLSDYPYSAVLSAPATPLIAGSGNVAAGSAAATLTGSATTTVYIAGFEADMGGATAGSIVAITVAGLLGGSRVYNMAVPTGAVLLNNKNVTFNPPLPASAVNTAISVTMASGGTGNTNASIVAHGYHM